MPELREYQQQGIVDIRAAFQQHRRALYVLPTAGGKTMMFSYIARGIARNNKRVLILAHREELLDQISLALDLWQVPHAVVRGGARGIPRTNVVVGSVFTIVRRLEHWPEVDLLICDEGHHLALGSSWAKVAERFPKARLLGVTATPIRLDGKGLGKTFDHLVEGPNVAQLTELGFLSEAEVYAPPVTADLKRVKRRGGDYVTSQLEKAMDRPSITGSAIEHYLRRAAGKRAIVFCVSVKHAKDVAEEFRRAGISAEHIDGGMGREERRAAIDRFRRGATQALTSCDLVSEGFDLPSIECAILLRPTESLGLYMQQVGRSLRIWPGKDRTIILDHAGNTRRHGLPDEARDWSLDQGVTRSAAKDDGIIRVRWCPKCFACHPPMPTCPRCGHVYVVGRVVQQRAGELELVGSPEEVRQTAEAASLREQYHQLYEIAKRRRHRNPQRFAFLILEARAAKRLAQQRDAVFKSLVNGLTHDERQSLWAETIGQHHSIPPGERFVPYGIQGGEPHGQDRSEEARTEE